eukprot:4772103-Alexandrium_andersonii.AAC.1
MAPHVLTELLRAAMGDVAPVPSPIPPVPFPAMPPSGEWLRRWQGHAAAFRGLRTKAYFVLFPVPMLCVLSGLFQLASG